MDDNTAKVWLALIGMAGSVLSAAISAVAAYFAIQARQLAISNEIKLAAVSRDLAGNTATTNQTNRIVNGERSKMQEELIDLRKQLAAVVATLELKRRTNEPAPAVVESVKTAIESVKGT